VCIALVRGAFAPDTKPTIGASTIRLPYDEQGRTNYFYIWDTAGQEQYRSLASYYFRNTAAGILVFDVTSRPSFEKLDYWVRSYREAVTENAPILLLGNKIDLPSRAVSEEDAAAWARQRRLPYLEISAKTHTNIAEILPHVIEMVGPTAGVGSDLPEHRTKCC
jgi:small GTP-binding protein